MFPLNRRHGIAAGLVAGLLALVPATGARAADPELSLPAAARQALGSNLDLISRRQDLDAEREEIGLARSALLPQLGIGARAQYLDSDRSDSARGNNKQRSVLVAAGLSQVLYDEDDWAGFDIQKHVYTGKVQELESFTLGVVQDAAGAFLNLDLARTVRGIQERNREVTRENLATSRARIAAGWSSEREVLRWQSQLAGNDSDVRAARVRVLQNLLELNRVRNLPPETPTALQRATIEELGFVYANEAIAEAIITPQEDERMRNLLVRVGLRRSPDLAALDASIEAAERQLVANRRAFWVPSLSLSAGVDHLVNKSNNDPNFNATEWGARGVLTFPIFEGGAKFVSLRQAQDVLASLRTDRSATALTLERSIRSAFAQASGSYESVGFSDRQVAAAHRNFELVDASYTLGVASILDLLDGQAQLLDANLALASATYGFLEDLVAAERAVAFYAFLETPSDVAAQLSQVEQELGLQP